jgi:putative ubiquitin-RnfH superfamily antitoxin RatB of RatAB toxin-antitoxin module
MSMGEMNITLVYSPAPREVVELSMKLATGSTVAQALAQSGWLSQYPELASLVAGGCGVWGRKVSLDTPLREQDRVEFYRPLKVDPKVARRERFRKQGARTSGLFAQRRPGAKPGY